MIWNTNQSAEEGSIRRLLKPFNKNIMKLTRSRCLESFILMFIPTQNRIFIIHSLTKYVNVFQMAAEGLWNQGLDTTHAHTHLDTLRLLVAQKREVAQHTSTLKHADATRCTGPHPQGSIQVWKLQLTENCWKQQKTSTFWHYKNRGNSRFLNTNHTQTINTHKLHYNQ